MGAVEATVVELVAEDGLRQGLQEDQQHLGDRVVATSCREHVREEHQLCFRHVDITSETPSVAHVQGFMNKDTKCVWDAGVQTVDDVLQLLLQSWRLEQVLLETQEIKRKYMSNYNNTCFRNQTFTSENLLVQTLLPDHRIW